MDLKTLLNKCWHEGMDYATFKSDKNLNDFYKANEEAIKSFNKNQNN